MQPKKVAWKTIKWGGICSVIFVVILYFMVATAGMSAGQTVLTILIWVVGIIIGLALYCLPTIVAWLRDAEDFWPVVLINFFLGWSGVGWCVALLFALGKVEPERIPPPPQPKENADA